METSTTPTTTAKRVKTADQPLVGEVIAHIGALIWNEKPESTCFISKQVRVPQHMARTCARAVCLHAHLTRAHSSLLR